jgi:hypothetical protein
MNKQSNVFDPIANTLDKDLFDGINPRPKVVSFIEKTIFDKINKHYKFDVSKYIDLYWTGSTTTYQYSKTADIDIHIFVNYIKWPVKVSNSVIRKKLVQICIEEINDIKIPDTQHPLQAFIIKDGIEPLDNFDVGLRSAWDFSKKKWLVKPEKDRTINVLNDTTEIYAKAMRISEQMDLLLEENPSEAYKLYKKIWRKRQKGQKIYGDFSEENIIYKFLEHSGQLDKVKKLHNKISSILKDASLDEVLEKAEGYLEEELANPGSRFYDPYNLSGRGLSISIKGNDVIAMSVGVEDLSKRRIPQVGLYLTHIKMDPDSRQLYDPETKSGYKAWECTCPWGQVSWDRKKMPQYEGRPCSHVYALYWYASKPTDEAIKDVEVLLGTNPPEDVEKILQREQQTNESFNEGDIVEVKWNTQVPVKSKNTEEILGQTYQLGQGYAGRVINYNPATNMVVIRWQDPDQANTYINNVEFEDQLYPGWLFKRTERQNLPQDRSKNKPVKDYNPPQIQEAQEPPVINEIP